MRQIDLHIIIKWVGSTIILASGWIFFFAMPFFDEISFSIQNRPIWNTRYCGLTSGTILFANVTQWGHQVYMYVC